jgi:hypothetical protein
MQNQTALLDLEREEVIRGEQLVAELDATFRRDQFCLMEINMYTNARANNH